MTRHVLGINAYHGDAAACILADGEVLLAVEEERLNRRKHCAGFPALAVKACMEAAGIGPGDLDEVAVSRRPGANLHKKILFSLGNLMSGRAFDAVKKRLSNSARIIDSGDALAAALGCERADLPQVRHIEHHVAHLASTFFASGWSDAALLSIDGFGDFVSTKMGIGQGTQIKSLGQVEFPHSSGILYTAATQFIGFPHYGDEGKVMGLAAYGEPTYKDIFSEIIELTSDGFKLDLDWFTHHSEGVDMSWDDGSPTVGRVWSDKWSEMLGEPRQPGTELTKRDRDVAASLQATLEDIYTHVLHVLHARTGSSRLCLAGGVAYNSVANGKIRSTTPFEDVYVVCAAGDSGTALGAAYVAHHALSGTPRAPALASAFIGPSYSIERCHEALLAAGLEGEQLDDADLMNRTAEAISAGEVVGWFQGRVEFGPRALGNRSIVADPRRDDMKDILNARIKQREAFRPFAPSVLEEHVAEWFDDDYPSPDMLMVYGVLEEQRARVPAISHADHTARVQTVSSAVNARYHALIKAFGDLTGVPMLLNTSFNENEPVVCSPEDAINCFMKTGMDLLVLENIMVRGKGTKART